MKYKLGDIVYYVESSTRFTKQIPCPICFGKKYVTVILGDDSQIKSECGMCSHGIYGPSGIATTWEPEAVVHTAEISGISNRDGIRYEVGGTSKYEHELYDTPEEAKLIRDIKFDEVTTIAKKWYDETFVTCTKKQIWSVGYHRGEIKRAERSIEWHKSRLLMCKEAKTLPINPEET